MVLNKKPVSWHENNLKNKLEYLQRELKLLTELKEKCDRLKTECNISNAQIQKAKKLNIAAFDETEAKFTKDLCITKQV